MIVLMYNNFNCFLIVVIIKYNYFMSLNFQYVPLGVDEKWQIINNKFFADYIERASKRE